MVIPMAWSSPSAYNNNLKDMKGSSYVNDLNITSPQPWDMAGKKDLFYLT